MIPASVTMDLAAAAVMILCMILGRKRGLLRSFMGLAAVVIALLLASRIAQFSTDLLIDCVLRPASAAAVERRVDELLTEPVLSTSPLEEMEQLVASVPNELIREKAAQLLKQMEISAEEIAGHSAREMLLAWGMELLDAVLNTVVRGMIFGVLYLLSFLLVMIGLKILTGMLDLTLKLPLLRQVSAGIAIVCCTMIAAALCAWLFPIDEQEGDA